MNIINPHVEGRFFHRLPPILAGSKSHDLFHLPSTWGFLILILLAGRIRTDGASHSQYQPVRWEQGFFVLVKLLMDS